MVEIFKAAIERGASDIHIKSGDNVRARIHGSLVPITQQKLSGDQVRALAQKLMLHEKDRARINDLLDYDCSWGLPGLGRFRVNILRQRGSFMIVMRVIPIEIPSVVSPKSVLLCSPSSGSGARKQSRRTVWGFGCVRQCIA